MNLEQALHEHWAGSTQLEAVLPAERLTTGRTKQGSPPYATLDLRAIRSQLPTNQGPAIQDFTFRIDLWHRAYDSMRTMVEQIRETFDGAALELSEPSRTARIDHATDAVRQHPDGLWQWSIGFVARICRLP